MHITIKYATKSSDVTVVFVINYNTQTRKNVIDLFYTIKVQMIYLKDFWGKKKEKTNLLTWI